MNRVLVFAHFDINNTIQEYVLFYLKELKRLCKTVIFVSDSDLTEKEIEKLNNLSDFNIIGHHGEYDFGSYKKGYEFAVTNALLDNADELLFVNDSCYGPFFSMEKIFSRMKKENTDFWGLSENKFGFDHSEKNPEIKPHVQSYFMVFNKNVFESDCFKTFIFSVTKEKDKNDVIRKYEVGLTQNLVQNGYTFCSFVGKTESPNIVLEHPVKLIKSGFPLLKTSICRGKNIQYLTLFYGSFLKRYTNYPINLIKEDVKQNKVPTFKFSFSVLKKSIIKVRLKQRELCFCGEWYKF